MSSRTWIGWLISAILGGILSLVLVGGFLLLHASPSIPPAVSHDAVPTAMHLSIPASVAAQMLLGTKGATQILAVDFVQDAMQIQATTTLHGIPIPVTILTGVRVTSTHVIESQVLKVVVGQVPLDLLNHEISPLLNQGIQNAIASFGNAQKIIGIALSPSGIDIAFQA